MEVQPPSVAMLLTEIKFFFFYLVFFFFFFGSWLLRCLSKAPCSGFPLLTKFLPCGYTVLSSTWVCWRARPKHEKHPLFLLRETTSRQIISCPWLRNLSTLCLCSHFIRLQLISCFFFSYNFLLLPMLWGQNKPLRTCCFLTGKHAMLARLFSPKTSGVLSFYWHHVTVRKRVR